MSLTVRRKSFLRTADEDTMRNLTDSHTIAQVLRPKGNDLFEVTDLDQSTFLVSMLPKFRKTMWIKRGKYVIVELIKGGKKVKGEIVKILTDQHINCFQEDQEWWSTEDNEKNRHDVLGNPNRPHLSDSDHESSDDEGKSGDSNDFSD